jgi:hypothetical protein
MRGAIEPMRCEMAMTKSTKLIPAGLRELLEAVALVTPYEWCVELERGAVSARAELSGEQWRIIHTPQRQPAPSWQVARGSASIGGADSALDAMALVLVKHREELDRERVRVGNALADVTMRITELADDEDQPAQAAAPAPEVRREPQGATRRPSETAMAPQRAAPDETQDRAWQRQMARYEALLDETDLSPDERARLRDQLCAKRHVPSLTQLLPSTLQEVCDWLQKSPADRRGAAIRLHLAAKR